MFSNLHERLIIILMCKGGHNATEFVINLLHAKAGDLSTHGDLTASATAIVMIISRVASLCQ